MGLGYLEYNRENYTSALEHFRNALRLCPSYANDARFHIGLSQFHLGKSLEAIKAFERVLSIDPDNCGALVTLAIVKSRSMELNDIRDAMNLVTRAFRIDPKNPTAQNYLANHFFFNNNTEKAYQLSASAYANTENDMIRSESCYQMGRYYHSKEDFNNAFQNYHQAVQLNKNNDLAMYGLGQMFILRNELGEALDIFQQLTKRYSDDHSVKMFICFLYVVLHRHKKDLDILLTYMEEIYDSQKADSELQVAYGELLQFNRPKESLEIWENVVTKNNEGIIISPFELHNNIACLAFQLKDYQLVKLHLQTAFNILKDRNLDLNVNRLFFSRKLALSRVKYNLGRLYETIHQQNNAVREYVSVICDRGMSESSEKIIDSQVVACSIIRFAWLCFEQKSDINNLTKCLKIARYISKDDATALSFLGRLMINRRNLADAQKHFESIMSKVKTDNSLVQYAKLALGNIWLLTFYNSTDKERRKRLLLRSLSFYKTVLENDPTNIYAANGVGCVLSYQNRIKEACDIFNLVKDATASFSFNFYMNLAHIHVEQGLYISGIHYYEACMEILPRPSEASKVLHLIARAYFRAGHYDKSLKLLTKIRWLEPENTVYVYNLGVVLKYYTLSFLKNDKSTYEQIKSAVENLEDAKRCFRNVSNYSTFEIVRANKQVNTCEEVLKQARMHLDIVKHKSEEDIINRKKYQDAVDVIRKKNEEEKLRKQLEEEKKKQEKFERRKAFLSSAESMLSEKIKSDKSSTVTNTIENQVKKPKKTEKKKTVRKRRSTSFLEKSESNASEKEQPSDAEVVKEEKSENSV